MNHIPSIIGSISWLNICFKIGNSLIRLIFSSKFFDFIYLSTLLIKVLLIFELKEVKPLDLNSWIFV